MPDSTSKPTPTSPGPDAALGKTAANAPSGAAPDARPMPPPPGAESTVNEEPELALEPDLPSDGRDEKGEAMIRDLPQRTELSEPHSQPRVTPQDK